MLQMRKRLTALLAALLLVIGLCSTTAQAAGVTVLVNGKTLSGAQLIGGTTYVPFKSFCTAMGAYSASVSNGTGTAKSSYTVQATAGNTYVVANGRYFYTGAAAPVKQVSGTLMVPVRALARAYGAAVTWNSSTSTAKVTGGSRIASGSSTYNSADLYWLSHIISAEAKGESLEGKIAVGNVILNRVNSSRFPNTMKSVILQVDNGVYQFSPVTDGTLYYEPTRESVIAAELVLDGAVAAPNALFFFNPSKSSATWIVRNCTYVTTIGSHAFYR